MKKNTVIIALACLAVGLGLGFFAGSYSPEKLIAVEHIKLSPIKLTPPIIPEPEIVYVKDPKLPAEIKKLNEEYRQLQAYLGMVSLEKDQNDHLIDSLKILLADMPEHVVDTVKLYRDYAALRSYEDWNMFDNDTIGRFTASFDVQFNRIQQVYDVVFHPIQKTVTIRKKDIWTPYISGSYSTVGYTGIGGGVFYHNLGLEYQYQRDFSEHKNGHLFGLKYRF